MGRGGGTQLVDWDFEPLPAHRKAVAEYKKSHKKTAVEDYMQHDPDDNDAGTRVCVYFVIVSVCFAPGVRFANHMMFVQGMIIAYDEEFSHTIFLHRSQICHITDGCSITHVGLCVCHPISHVEHECHR